MTSSMMTGERRWASARRGGMTVLGKVAVPKPINLPSQKLENHGLDPNVEIVPKGTVSWGSRSSSSASNPWGSSTLSPKADGNTGSPSHLSGRPSSGGSGTRPSTGSSDRAHEPIANAWSSNSRPSSASGALTSNQTSATSLRPRSAETRPGSSQLSRFAEPLSENSGPWGTAGTAEKLGVTSSKNDGFSLASGDFPTLGSEKDNSGKNMESQDLSPDSWPGSSSGGVAPVKDRIGTSIAGDASLNVNLKSEAANTWKRDNNPHGEDGVRPSVEKWQADPQGPHPYPNAGIPHQHYEAWHGPPINNHPGGVWYRGPPGPPFGSPVPPGGFPMEPFHFYRPQIPANAVANPQPVPPPGAGPRAHHPKNGDMYRPPLPDAYMRPGMPMRPGFYPGPVAYEGYYGPPMGYRNSNERDVPFMGMAASPHSYNRYSGQNAHDAGNSHGRSSACGPNGKALASEQVESGHSLDARGPYRVLLKHQDGWEGKDKQRKWEETVTANASHVEKGDQQKLLSGDDDWREDYKKDELMGLKRKASGEEVSYLVSDHEGGSSSVPVKVKSPKNMGNAKAVDDLSVKKVENVANASPEIPAGPKDSSLIQKIEGLNAKARASDGRYDLMSVSSKEQQKNTLQVANSGEAATGSVHGGKNHATGTNNPAAYEGSVTAGDKSSESTATGGPIISRRSTHGMHGRPDHRGKGRFSSQETDGWRRKSSVAESSTDISVAHSESSNIFIQDHPAKEVTVKLEFNPQGNDGGESMPSMSEPSDSQAQRAKMKELAKQRVKQRQEEEEERARDQRAKAFAKLEELNRRTQAVEGLTQMLEVVPSVAIVNKQEEFHSMAESTTIVASESGTSGLALISHPNIAAQTSESGNTRVEKSTVLSNERLLERPKSGHKEFVGMHKHGESVPIKQEVNDADVFHHNNAPQACDGSVSKQKRLNYKQKQNIPSEKNSSENFIATSAIEPLKGNTDLTVNAAASQEVVANQIAPSCDSSSPVNPNVMAESSIQQRRRNNRGGKKHKVEEASSGATLPSMVSTETNILNKTLAESGKTKTSESELDGISVQPLTDSNDASQSSELRLSSPGEENHVRANNQWKSQHSRRAGRSAQTSKSSEKFHTNEAVIWAPVRSQNKAEVTDESGHKSVVEASSVSSDNQGHNNSRNKRAEMERYVPKPVAKEMAQQGNGQQQPLAPTADKTMSDEMDGKADPGSQDVEGCQHAGFASGKKGIVLESKNGDHRQNKQGKVHGSWRQRASSESTVVQGLQDVHPSNTIRNVQKSVEHQRNQRPEVSSVKEQPKYSDEWSSDDGWNMPENRDSSAPVNVTVVKDQGVIARGKRHQFKGQKSTGNNHDHDQKKTNSVDSDRLYVQSSVPVPETSQTDLPSASKENRATGDRSTSHWQPKPQASVASSQRGSRLNSGPNVGAEVGRSNKKDSTDIPPQSGKETSEGVVQPHHGHSAFIISKVEATSNVVHQEPKRERKIASAKGLPDSPNQGPGSLLQNAPPSNIDVRNEQHMPSGYRRNGNQNSRFNRGHESRGDWSSSVQDNKQHNQPINRERQRHNAHYEYQPVGPYSNNRANNFEGPKDAPNNGGGRYRERGQSHSKRGGGNYHGRPSGTVRADGCD